VNGYGFRDGPAVSTDRIGRVAVLLGNVGETTDRPDVFSPVFPGAGLLQTLVEQLPPSRGAANIE
jgi:hypothetical protein